MSATRLRFKLVLLFFLLAFFSAQFARVYYAILPPVEVTFPEIIPLLYLREASYLALFVISFYLYFKSRLLLLIVTISFVTAWLVLRSMQIGHTENIEYGVRLIVIAIAGFALGKFSSSYATKPIFKIVDYAIVVTLVFYAFISVYQLTHFPPSTGETIFGSRTNGVFFNPILFSITLGAYSVYLYYSTINKKLFWLLICLGVAITTGGRAGMLVCFFTTTIYAMGRSYFSVKIFALLFFMPIIFMITSLAELSGRVGTEDAFKDGRLAKWEEVTKRNFSSIDNVIFGTGLGDGTNASSRNEESSVVAVSDSTFVTIFRSFGILGVIFYLAAFLYVFIKYKLDSIVFLFGVFIVSVSQSLMELHPTFLVISISMGLMISQVNSRKFIHIVDR